MKTIISPVIIVGIIVCLWFCVGLAPFANANNPFTAKQDNRSATETTVYEPALLSKVFLKIIVWQQYLKEKMTLLVRQAKADHSVTPIGLLILAAFAYGVIHAAGPGHGKAIALSYVLTQRPSYAQGLLFSNFIALFHGVSGILFVLFVRLILNTSIMDNLDSVTNITQVASYSIITCLGLGIFLYSSYKLVKGKHETRQGDNKNLNPVLSAAVVGCIPCPGVIIVMLFALSMDLFFLSIILGLAISIGMGFTISMVVLLAISGKVVSLNMVAKKDKKTGSLELWIELFAGMTLMILGSLFLGANL
ncbi:MAG: hypothetical protein K8R67_01935 [Desulfobacteraceae bacterium]|nr:hypothetical protein [Desulfobacteraceae bacterium]